MPYTTKAAARAAVRKRWAKHPKRPCPRCGKHLHRCVPDPAPTQPKAPALSSVQRP
jgi:hypothetical protein